MGVNGRFDKRLVVSGVVDFGHDPFLEAFSGVLISSKVNSIQKGQRVAAGQQKCEGAEISFRLGDLGNLLLAADSSLRKRRRNRRLGFRR